MGTSLISFYKEKIKQTWKTAFWSTFVFCLLIHIYKFTNTLPNHDTYYNVYSTQDITGSGRWFLQYVCGISSYFDLPWINGLLCAVYLGLTAAVVIEIFQIKNPIVIALSGFLLAASPCTTETLFFGYTADGYLLGLFLSALAACLSCKGNGWKRNILSGICLCLSLATYQAYLSFAAVLCICYLICRLLEGEMDLKAAWKWIGRHVLIYVTAMAAYYLLWKLLLDAKGLNAAAYQGISDVGHLTFSLIINGAINSVRNLVLFFVEWNILEHPATVYAVLNLVFMLGFAFILVTALIKSGMIHKPAILVFILFCLASCVPVISIWYFTSDNVHYRPMMMHSVCVLYILALILFDRWVGPRLSTMFGLFMAVVVFNFALVANIAYFYLNECNEKTYYIGSRIMEQIEETQNQYDDIESIAFIGRRVEQVCLTPEDHIDSIHIFIAMLERDLLYDHIHTYLYLTDTYDLKIPEATAEVIAALEATDAVKKMEAWPANSAVQVIDHVLVIKLGENS